MQPEYCFEPIAMVHVKTVITVMAVVMAVVVVVVVVVVERLNKEDGCEK